MISKLLTRGMALSLTLAVAACATTTPPGHHSILDALATQPSQYATSCAAMNAATVCERTTRLGSDTRCDCVDRGALTDGTLRGF